jgi:hypothetical protein
VWWRRASVHSEHLQERFCNNVIECTVMLLILKLIPCLFQENKSYGVKTICIHHLKSRCCTSQDHVWHMYVQAWVEYKISGAHKKNKQGGGGKHHHTVHNTVHSGCLIKHNVHTLLVTGFCSSMSRNEAEPPIPGFLHDN